MRLDYRLTRPTRSNILTAVTPAASRKRRSRRALSWRYGLRLPDDCPGGPERAFDHDHPSAWSRESERISWQIDRFTAPAPHPMVMKARGMRFQSMLLRATIRSTGWLDFLLTLRGASGRRRGSADRRLLLRAAAAATVDNPAVLLEKGRRSEVTASGTVRPSASHFAIRS
jgi:hypothetical protein